MIDKNLLLKKLEDARNIVDSYGLNDIISAEASKLTAEINEYVFRVLMIGGFSSGKSAFLNTLIDRPDTLIESQAPETTIAAELTYGKENDIVAVSESGERRVFPLSSGGTLSPKDWKYLIYRLDCEYLKEHSDMVLVDMPGLDSDNEWHNKAISRYITRGSAFILLVSCKDGTLKKSTRSFLGEAVQYPQSLACFVSMTDLMPAFECETVEENIRGEIREFYGKDVPVEGISVADNDFGERADRVLSNFDPQALFENYFRDRVNRFLLLCQTTLATSRDALVLDVAQIDRQIKECSKNKEELKKRLDAEKRALSQKYRDEVIPAIRDDIVQALTEQSDRLTESLMLGNEAFNSSVNSILRPVIYRSINQHLRESFDDIVSTIDLSFLNSDGNSELGRSITEGLQMMMSTFDTLKTHFEAVLPDEDSNPEKKISGVLAALAILTDVINPVIELIIVVLPVVLSLFSNLNRRGQIRDLESKMRNSIIPMIADRLMEKIEEIVKDAKDAMIDELENKMNVLITAQEEALKGALAEKDAAVSDHRTKQDAYTQDIETLRRMLG